MNKPAKPTPSYTISLTNSTALPPADYDVYVMGFSVASGTVLVSGTDGVLVANTGSTPSTVASYPVGTGSGRYHSISLDATQAFVGGRFYFFVVAKGQPAPSVSFGQQPPNPGTNPEYPPFSIVELTIPAPVNGAAQNATIDVQTVDGFVFPLTIGLNGGQSNSTGNVIFGQPLGAANPGALVSRAGIFSAYKNFMAAQGTAGAPYQDMLYLPHSVAGQPGGLLNPGAYLTAQDRTGKYLNLASPLHTAFDADLATLFAAANTGMQVQGVPSNPSGVPGEAYTVTPVTKPYADTRIPLPALEFASATGGYTFHIFNPVGTSILADDAGGNILGSITNTTVAKVPTTTLTLAPGVIASRLAPGMYVAGAGLAPDATGKSTTRISAIAGNVLTLSPALTGGDPAPGSQYVFSVQPYLSMMLTPGQMVFGNAGFFADSSIQFPTDAARASVLASLENYLVTALNRGVAVAAGALNPAASPGNNGTSLYWGTPANWYPAGATQNLFSLFMHVSAVDAPGASGSSVPVFLRPYQPVANARGQIMGSAYGFAYDENGGPTPPVPPGPEVPSKFDGTVAPASSIQVTLGPWFSTKPATSAKAPPSMLVTLNLAPEPAIASTGDATAATINGAFLNGLTASGDVNLAPNTLPPCTGTIWQYEPAAQAGAVTLKCLGDYKNPAFQYLDGRTRDGSVALVPNTQPPYTGTSWAVDRVGFGAYTLKCLGDVPVTEHRYLQGDYRSSRVSLGADGAAGTWWSLRPARLAIYIGDELYPNNGVDPKTAIDQLQQSHVTTAIASLVNQGSNNLVYNEGGNPLFDAQGHYIGVATWPDTLRRLRGGNISEVYLSFSTNGTQFLSQLSPTARTRLLDFVKQELGFDGIDLDYENDPAAGSPIYPVADTAIACGLKLTAAPYFAANEWLAWVEYVQKKGGDIPWLNVQCYSGGSSNDPTQSQWSDIPTAILGGVEAGWATTSVQSTVSRWTQQSLQLSSPPKGPFNGAFVWAYSGMKQNFTAFVDAMHRGLLG